MTRYLTIVIAAIFFISCSKPPDYPNEPEITFENISKDSMRQSNLNIDSLFVTFSYTDGDGNLGWPEDDNRQSVFVIDTRTGVVENTFKIPEIPDQGTANGIFGEMTLRLYTTCCIFPQGIPPCSSPAAYPRDSVSYEIYIVDRDGNESNRIQTPPITLLCR